jgi:NitT/TauT family transport system permease protein
MIKFFIGCAAFVAVLTAIVRFAKMVVRKEQTRTNALATTLGCAGLMLLGWFLLTMGATIEQRIVPPLILPSPAEVVQAFPRLHFEQALVRNALTSFQRVTLGFTLAAMLAVPLGLYMGTFPAVGNFFKPVSLVGSYVPIVVFAPLTVAWFGTSETQKVVFLFIGCFVALLPQVIKTVAGVNGAYLEVAATKGASNWQLVKEVLFPVAQADIWDHLRGIYGVGWGWIILAEVYSGDRGLGYLISISERRGHTNSIFAIVIGIVAIAVVCDQLWRLGGELLFPYRQRK